MVLFLLIELSPYDRPFPLAIASPFEIVRINSSIDEGDLTFALINGYFPQPLIFITFIQLIFYS